MGASPTGSRSGRAPRSPASPRSTPGPEEAHKRRRPGLPVSHCSGRGPPARAQPPALRAAGRRRSPEAPRGGDGGRAGSDRRRTARYSPGRRQRRTPAFRDSSCGIFPPATARVRAALAAADGAARQQARRGERGRPPARPGPGGLAQCPRRSLGSSVSAGRGHVTSRPRPPRPPPCAAGDVTVRRWRAATPEGPERSRGRPRGSGPWGLSRAAFGIFSSDEKPYGRRMS